MVKRALIKKRGARRRYLLLLLVVFLSGLVGFFRGLFDGDTPLKGVITEESLAHQVEVGEPVAPSHDESVAIPALEVASSHAASASDVPYKDVEVAETPEAAPSSPREDIVAEVLLGSAVAGMHVEVGAPLMTPSVADGKGVAPVIAGGASEVVSPLPIDVVEVIHGSPLAQPISKARLSEEGPASEGRLDMSFIQGGAHIDPVTWDMLNSAYMPGRYLLDVTLNGEGKGKQMLEVMPEDKEGLCLSMAWLVKAGIYIKPDYFEEGFDKGRQCYALEQARSVRVDFDATTQALALTIPQVGLGAAPSELDWDYGEPALRLNYNANTNVNQVDTTAYGSASIKANVGKWVFNGSSSISDGNGELSLLTGTRALQDWKADLTLGKTYVGESMLGGVGINGFTLSSNNSMRPGNIGYAPVFAGVANSHARITLTQMGRTIHSEVVPPGPFAISDIALLSSGDVEMLIVEADGSERRQRYPLTVMGGLVKPGQHEFTLSAGVKDETDVEYKTPGAMASLSYGYGLEALTLRTGGVFHSQYQGASLSVVSSLGDIGGVSLEGAYARAQYDTQPDRQGSKVKLGYSKSLETGTSIQTTWGRQLTPDYVEFSEFSPQDPKQELLRRSKNDISLSVSQSLGRGLSLGVSGWRRDYWHSTATEEGITGSIGATVKGVGVSLAGSYSQGSEYSDNYSVSLSVSVPFDLFDKPYSLSNTVSSDSNGRVYATTGMSGSFNDRASYSVSGGGGNDGSRQASFSTGYQADKASMYMNVNQNQGKSNSSTTGSASVSGSLLALPRQGSVVLSRNISDTIGVVNVQGAQGVKMQSGMETTDSSGNLVVSLSSYGANSVTVDASTLPSNMELTSTTLDVMPTGQAVLWMPFETWKVRRYVLQVRQRDGKFVPGGSWALNAQGAPLGFVAPNGVLMLNLVDAPGDMTIGDCHLSAGTLKETDQLQEVKCEG